VLKINLRGRLTEEVGVAAQTFKDYEILLLINFINEQKIRSEMTLTASRSVADKPVMPIFQWQSNFVNYVPDDGLHILQRLPGALQFFDVFTELSGINREKHHIPSF
jgi:hypothetical protein